MFLEISQNSLEKHLCQIPFFNKVASLSGTGCEFREISNNTFSHRTPPVAASEITIEYAKKLQNLLLIQYFLKAEVYLEPIQIPEIELSVKIANSFMPLIILTKSSIVDV